MIAQTIWRACLMLAFVVAPAAAFAQACGVLANGYGPYDYRRDKDKLSIVETYHFTPDVETLRGGSTGALGSDLDYTLRAFPNHHRALNAIANLALKLRVAKPPGAQYTVDCYFDRALRFAEDDGTVRIIYGVYLSRTNRMRDAVRAFEAARAYEPDNANLYYNLGLAYLDLKDYSKALENAQRAYQLGAALPGLRNRLQAAGKWSEPSGRQGAATGTNPAEAAAKK